MIGQMLQRYDVVVSAKSQKEIFGIGDHLLNEILAIGTAQYVDDKALIGMGEGVHTIVTVGSRNIGRAPTLYSEGELCKLKGFGMFHDQIHRAETQCDK